jgi:DNA polymerase-3 subunit alpha
VPDIEIDFGYDDQEKVVNYVIQKYGYERVGRIICVGTLGAKAVIRDVARALNISLDESDMITRLIPFAPRIVRGRPGCRCLLPN